MTQREKYKSLEFHSGPSYVWKDPSPLEPPPAISQGVH